jgi:sodium/hydrogen antiporter
VGAALAPTDAALGAGVMLNRAVPARISRLINVESGLNDGIATPFVLVALAGAGTAAHEPGIGPGAAVAELPLGLAVCVAVGGPGGWLVMLARRRGWAAEGFAGAAVLGLAVCAYASAVALHGNGFIAAFVGGLAFGAAAGRRGEPLVLFVEETRALVPLLVWLAFGAAAITPALEGLTWQLVMYAVLSLTVIRMAPVALALAGAGLGRRAAAFIGWLGPRGLASVVFALRALEDLGEQVARPAVAVIAVTVLSSVIAHGSSTEPPARRYGRCSSGPPSTMTRPPRLSCPPAGHPAATSAGHRACAAGQARLTDQRRLYRKRSTCSRLHVPPELADLHSITIPASRHSHARGIVVGCGSFGVRDKVTLSDWP